MLLNLQVHQVVGMLRMVMLATAAALAASITIKGIPVVVSLKVRRSDCYRRSSMLWLMNSLRCNHSPEKETEAIDMTKFTNSALSTAASCGIGLELARIHASKGGNLVLVARGPGEAIPSAAGRADPGA